MVEITGGSAALAGAGRQRQTRSTTRSTASLIPAPNTGFRSSWIATGDLRATRIDARAVRQQQCPSATTVSPESPAGSRLFADRALDFHQLHRGSLLSDRTKAAGLADLYSIRGPLLLPRHNVISAVTKVPGRALPARLAWWHGSLPFRSMGRRNSRSSSPGRWRASLRPE